MGERSASGRSRRGMSLRMRLTAGFSLIFTLSGALLVGGVYLFARSVPTYGTVSPQGSTSIELTPMPSDAIWSPGPESSAMPLSPGAPEPGAVDGACADDPPGGICSDQISMEWMYYEDPMTLGTRFLVSASVLLLLLIAVSTWGSWLLAGRVLRPIHRVREAAEAAARGSFDHRLALSAPRRGEDEVVRLATTFDTMLERIDRFARDQRRVAAHASHELRGPLAATQMLLDGFDPDELGTEQGRMLLTDLRRSNERNILIVETILDLAELSLSDVPQDQVPLDVVVDGILEESARAGAANGIRFSTDLESCFAAGDELLLEQAIRNIIGNAVKHSPTGGIVDTRLAVSSDAVCLRVENGGREISDEEAAMLTQPYYRRAPDGVDSRGVGLAFVQSVTEAHGGELRLTPRPDGGLVVTLVLKRYAVED